MTSRPNASASLIDGWLNDRVRHVLDARTFWSDLVRRGILSIPENYITGTVNVTLGSSVVAGTATAWPVNDVVDTVIPDAVGDIGWSEVVPASMTGITENSMLYVDAAGDPETVPVARVDGASFIGKFTKTHNAGATVTQSSLANQQFRISNAYPIFTVKAVHSATEFEMDNPWGGTSLTAQAYRICLMYVVLSSRLKGIIAMKDEQTGYPVRLHVSLDEANFRDPRRSIVTGNPYFNLIDLGANEQGNMLYEIWPAPSAVRQFSYMFWEQWPELVKDTDRFPPFINPSVFQYGAIADALCYKQGAKDPFHNPNLASRYEAKFEQALAFAKNADEAKCLSALSNFWGKGMTPGTADQLQLNDPAWGQLWSGASFM
jgi:hypothetical protein